MAEWKVRQGQVPVSSILPKLQTKLWKWFVGTWRPLLLLIHRLHLGWLLNHWLVIVTHTGRRSGRDRRTILYVQHCDPQTKETTVVSAWGVTDWYRNICATPATEIEICMERYVPKQRILEPEEIAELERQFRYRHPIIARVQCWLMNWPWRCSEEEFLERRRLSSQVVLDVRYGSL